MLKMMVSVKDVKEALLAAKGGTQLIDVKNPSEGSLGANYPWVITQIRKKLSASVEISATIGDAHDLPGTYALAAAGAAACGVDYVKVGLLAFSSESNAVYFLQQLKEAIDFVSEDIKLMVAGYGDHSHPPCVSIMSIPKIAAKAEISGCMLDTYDKTQGNLLNYVKESELKKFIYESHNAGLLCALAGSLQHEHVTALHNLQPDIVGLRGAVCEGYQRTGVISLDKVKRLKAAFHEISVPYV